MLDINPGLIIWTIVTFLILMFLLTKLAWKPLLSALEKREEHIRSSIDRAEKAARDAEHQAAENKKHIANAEVKASKLLKEGHELGEKLKAEIVEKAHHHARHMVESAKLEIEREKEAALLKLRSEVADLAIIAAKKIIGETLDVEKHRKVVDSYLDELPKN
ncbi:MAG: F0F1 ATP synthase subunit B [Bacteroidota bacterium]|nr:F0F1 ATP synthase subunit B [Bacteroidota bacterium]